MKLKNQVFSLDDLDLKILHIIQENSKQTYSEVGRQLGVAHSTVYDRIRKLEKSGVIKKWTVELDLETLGLNHITALMTVYTDPKESENVAKKLSDAKEVLEVSLSLSEELLILVKVLANDQDELHSFIAKKVAPLQGVLRIRTSIITKKIKEERFLITT
ncbi:MAG: Lrp/AsnC family transcriptional regulator [Candidatus Bathyarchaeota archaeon]|nr:Lrp/AsnC family transcriptional regulator [Candidatus Bathyarchaeum sp.]